MHTSSELGCSQAAAAGNGPNWGIPEDRVEIKGSPSRNMVPKASPPQQTVSHC